MAPTRGMVGGRWRSLCLVVSQTPPPFIKRVGKRSWLCSDDTTCTRSMKEKEMIPQEQGRRDQSNAMHTVIFGILNEGDQW